MKRASILILGLLALALFANVYRNELAVWFNADSFYKPIFTGDLDVLHPGSIVRAELTPSYDVRHGFFLTFPCEDLRYVHIDDMEGVVRYSFYANGIELESKTITIPRRPMMGIHSGGTCDIVLFTFDLPYHGHSTVTLEVVVESPILKLAPYREDIKCEVSPAYWPK